jgi:predicted transcriptional regulator
MESKILEWKKLFEVDTDTELAAILCVSSSTITSWRKGRGKPSKLAEKLVNSFIEVRKKYPNVKMARM